MWLILTALLVYFVSIRAESNIDLACTQTIHQSSAVSVDFFNSLVHPKTLSEFLRGYFEQAPLVLLRKKANFYAPMISLNEIAPILDAANITYGKDWKLVKGVMKDGNLWTGVLPVQELKYSPSVTAMGAIRKGFSLIINRIQRHSLKLHQVARMLEDALGLVVNINLYMSPAKSQGFEVHFDWMDGLIVQILGRKEWTVYDPVVFPFPRPDSVYHLSREMLAGNHSNIMADKQVFTLSAGEVTRCV
jgi:ribosomal protein L16 Arg81 hydroxylase